MTGMCRTRVCGSRSQSEHFDEQQAAPVAIINETMARMFWPNEDAVGKRFRALFSPWITVVGIVGDVRQSGLLEPPTPQMYLSNLQEPSGAMTIVVRRRAIRSRRSGGATSDPFVRCALADRFDRDHGSNRLELGWSPAIQRVSPRHLGRHRSSSRDHRRLRVMSYSAQRRTHEIGIRRALGAQTRDVFRLVLGQTLGLVFAGIVAGAIGAIALTRVLATLLYDVAPTDPPTFLSWPSTLALVALLAGYLPGRRATRVDPTDALSSE